MEEELNEGGKGRHHRENSVLLQGEVPTDDREDVVNEGPCLGHNEQDVVQLQIPTVKEAKLSNLLTFKYVFESVLLP